MTEPVYSTLERTHAHTYVRTDNIEMEFLVHRDKGEKKKIRISKEDLSRTLFRQFWFFNGKMWVSLERRGSR